MNIVYKVGDVIEAALNDNGDQLVIIPHICNDLGKWGSGFVVSLSNVWPEPEGRYRSLSKYELGKVQFVNIPDFVCVANMIAQHKTWSIGGVPPIRYNALRDCMIKVRDYALSVDAKIMAPRFGSDRAGGDWNKIETMINEIWIRNGIDVEVYQLR